jgi:hypothetical protein
MAEVKGSAMIIDCCKMTPVQSRYVSLQPSAFLQGSACISLQFTFWVGPFWSFVFQKVRNGKVKHKCMACGKRSHVTAPGHRLCKSIVKDEEARPTVSKPKPTKAVAQEAPAHACPVSMSTLQDVASMYATVASSLEEEKEKDAEDGDMAEVK